MRKWTDIASPAALLAGIALMSAGSCKGLAQGRAKFSSVNPGQIVSDLPEVLKPMVEMALARTLPGIVEGTQPPAWLADLDAGRLDAVERQLRKELDIADTLPPPDQLGKRGGDDNRWMMELGMLRMAQGDLQQAIGLLGPASEISRRRSPESGVLYLTGGLKELMSGDNPAGEYVGGDYEGLIALGMLAITDYLEYSGDGDSYAYAYRLQEEQERILASSFGVSDRDYYPRQQYQRLALGKYLEGIFLEVRRNGDAELAFADAARWAPEVQLLSDAAARTEFAPRGHGVLHVIHLAGRGPSLRTTAREADELSRDIATMAVAASGDLSVSQEAIADAFLKPVPLAEVEAHPWSASRLQLRIPALGVEVVTETLLEVAQVARQQQQQMESLNLARSLLWRAGAQQAVNTVENEQARWLAGMATGFVDRADTRCWECLPSRFDVARLELREGHHRLELSDGSSAEVAIRPGRTSLLVVVQRSEGQPGQVMVDRRSRP